MSSRSNFSLYGPYGGSITSGPSQSASRIGVPKEQEVDALTDMLIQGMGGEGEGYVYGVCVKCGEKVVGENSGCTAMDQIYHTRCFTCHQCAINLQGKPFYSLDGNPYCEEDYLVIYFYVLLVIFIPNILSVSFSFHITSQYFTADHQSCFVFRIRWRNVAYALNRF